MSDAKQIIVKLVQGLNWVENHPTILLDTDLLEAVNQAPGCENCYSDALNIISELGDLP